MYKCGNIDGDLVAFRCAASTALSISHMDLANLSVEEIQKLMYPDETQEIAILRADVLMRELLQSTQVDEFNCFLSGRNNFRKKVYPEYKANRKDKTPPRWLQQCREYLIKEWNATVSDGCEADDLLGIAQHNEDTICISLDKDLLMVPGWHFNWLHNEESYTTPLDGLRTFYKQMMIGDKADNIIGVTGIGKVKAAKLIDHLESEQDMLDVVYNEYKDNAVRFLQNAMCLWIMQKENETWVNRNTDLILPSQLQHEVETMLSSMSFMMEGTLMEPTMNPAKISGIHVNGIIPESMEAVLVP